MRRLLPAFLSALAVLLVDLLSPPLVAGGGMGISSDPDPLDPNAPQAINLPFHRYQVPDTRSRLAHRDIEFFWSDTYRGLGKPLVPPGGGEEENDLDRLGITECTDISNPFGFPFTDIQMVYDYFNVPIPGFPGFRDTVYTIGEQFPGFRVAAKDDPSDENDHVDTYIWLKGIDDAGLSGSFNYSSYTSNWEVPAEDSVTSDPSTYHLNSFDIIGPNLNQVGVTDSTRWTGQGSAQNAFFNHEFQHAVNIDKHGPVPFLHLFSSAAEVVGGFTKDPPIFDVPYTWNLIRSDENGGNYQGWQSLSGYIAFNFRGIDNFIARADDLLWRWAHKPERTLTSLTSRLSPGECEECETPAKSYFAGLSPRERFHLLLHNWRIAQFVNKPSLAQGQYGFPPQFGFDPIKDIGNWKNVDPGATDSVNVPHEITLSTAHITREISHAGPWIPGSPTRVHALGLEEFGSDYWVIRSDPSLWGSNRDLVVRVAPEGDCAPRRLMVSVVAYAEENFAGQPDALWEHPEWVASVIGPQSLDLDLGGAGSQRIEVVLQNFGATYKAALVVVTLGRDTDSGAKNYVLPYRLNATLRTGSYQSPIPLAVQTESTVDSDPAWSPAGDEVAYMRAPGPGVPSQVYRKKLDGTPATPLIPQPVSQFNPDWSPRGDWIVFDQETTPGKCDIFAYNPTLSPPELRQLSNHPEHEHRPAFSPNGQRVAWLLTSGDVGGSGSTTAEIRVVDITGLNTGVLVSRQCFGSCSIPSLRWAPDGQWIYYLTNDSLYAVGAAGANTGVVVGGRRLPNGTYQIHLSLGGGRIAMENQWTRTGCSGFGIGFRAPLHDTT